MFAAAISLVGLAATIYLVLREAKAIRAQSGTVAKSALGWSVVFGLFQLFLTIWGAIGLVAQNEPLAFVMLILTNAILTGCAWASIARDRIAPRVFAFAGPDAPAPTGKLSRLRGAFVGKPLVAAVLCLLLAGVFALLGMEVSSNHDFTWVYPLCILLEWAIITVLMVGLFFLFQRHGAAPAVLAFALFILGIAEFFVITFKSMPIQPGDLSAISTAAAVAGNGYTFSISLFCVLSMGFTAIAMLLCEYAGLVAPHRQKGAANAKRMLLTNLLVAVLCLGGVTAHVTLIDYYNTLGITVYTWRPLESYWREGYLPAFISAAQSIKPPKPADYSVDDAKATLKKYAKAYDKSNAAKSDERAAAEEQFDSEKPTVIAIMNETFSDLSIYQNMRAGYEGPQYFKSLSNCLSRGKLYVSAYGGGTANTEFEFMTGNSMANLGSGVYPYTIYNMETTGNLAEQFKSLGYSTTAMHPNHATNWNRENVYKDFGFDQFLSINDFQGADTLRGMVTDQATYDKILELLDQNADPQFIFDVTMQNHSGYDTGLLPVDKQLHLNIDTTDLDTKTVEDGTLSDVDEYVSCIEQSDQALRYFLNALSKLDRKVVVVFWGDHQPFFPSKFNDKWFTDEDDATHQERLWQTDYIIWANYDVAGCDQTSEVDDLSTNYLSTQLMQLIGAPLTDYQKAHMTLRESLPAINSVATRTPVCVGRFPPTSPVTTPLPQPPPRRARITPRCNTTRCSATARTCIPSTSRPRPTRPTPTWRRARPRLSSGSLITEMSVRAEAYKVPCSDSPAQDGGHIKWPPLRAELAMNLICLRPDRRPVAGTRLVIGVMENVAPNACSGCVHKCQEKASRISRLSHLYCFARRTANGEATLPARPSWRLQPCCPGLPWWDGPSRQPSCRAAS